MQKVQSLYTLPLTLEDAVECLGSHTPRKDILLVQAHTSVFFHFNRIALFFFSNKVPTDPGEQEHHPEPQYLVGRQ